VSAREAGQDFAVRGAFTARGEVSLTGQLLVTLSTGTRVDDLDVSGASCVICDTSVQTEITGFASGAKRNVLCVANRQSSTANVILSARDTNSGSDNRIITDVDVIIAPGYGATFVWSELLTGGGGWRCVGLYAAPETELATEGAITVADGRAGSGVALTVGSQARGFVVGDWTITGWRLVSDVAGQLRVRLYKAAGSSYDNSTWSDVTGGLVMPTISAGNVNGASTSLGSWSSTTLTDGDVLRADVNSNIAGAGWYALQINGVRTVARA
jgi:hypothetical protein